MAPALTINDSLSSCTAKLRSAPAAASLPAPKHKLCLDTAPCHKSANMQEHPLGRVHVIQNACDKKQRGIHREVANSTSAPQCIKCNVHRQVAKTPAAACLPAWMQTTCLRAVPAALKYASVRLLQLCKRLTHSSALKQQERQHYREGASSYEEHLSAMLHSGAARAHTHIVKSCTVPAASPVASSCTRGVTAPARAISTLLLLL